jgi:catechol 2,3-dioxygenase-like lactoylglutathione lyase family enzyme
MITAMPRIAIATADFDGMVHTCRQVLGLPVIDLSEAYAPVLGARLAMCVPPGGSNIELMSPALAEAPLSQSLQRFLDRRGPGLFALMLEAPDPDAEAVQLAARGLRVLPRMPAAEGRDLHPASTCGVLIRVYPVDSFTGRPEPGTPVGPLSGIQRVLVAVHDLVQAIAIYGHGLGLVVEAPVHEADRGVVRATVRPPAGGCIDLLAVHDAARPFAAAIAAQLAERGEGLHALELQAPDPLALLPGWQAAGLRAAVATDAPDVVVIAPEALAGARIRVSRATT